MAEVNGNALLPLRELPANRKVRHVGSSVHASQLRKMKKDGDEPQPCTVNFDENGEPELGYVVPTNELISGNLRDLENLQQDCEHQSNKIITLEQQLKQQKEMESNEIKTLKEQQSNEIKTLKEKHEKKAKMQSNEIETLKEQQKKNAKEIQDLKQKIQGADLFLDFTQSQIDLVAEQQGEEEESADYQPQEPIPRAPVVGSSSNGEESDDTHSHEPATASEVGSPLSEEESVNNSTRPTEVGSSSVDEDLADTQPQKQNTSDVASADDVAPNCCGRHCNFM